MFKLCILSVFFAAVSAGYLGAPIAHTGYSAIAAPAYHTPISYAPAPIIKTVLPAPVYHHAPIVKTVVPAATSYANTYKVSVKAPVAYAAPIHAVHAAPAYVHAAPAYGYAAPAIHAAPIGIAHGASYGYGHSVHAAPAYYH